MKKTKLRGLIREEIQNIFEQSGSFAQATGSCDVNQAAQNSVVYFVNGAHPQLGDVGINQNFVNNMAGKTPNFYTNRRAAFQQKRESLEISGQGFCQGENPHWQAKLKNKELYAAWCHMSYNHPNLTPC